MKILHILGDSGFGGAAKSILRLAQLWDSSGWNVTILTSDRKMQEEAAQSGIRFDGLDCIWREIRPLRDLYGLIRLWLHLREEGLDIVHTHTTKAGFVGRIAARLAGVPIIVHTIHGFAFHEQSPKWKIAFYALLERIAGLCCDQIIAVSRFHRDWAIDLGIAAPDKIMAIPNGIPTPAAETSQSRGAIRSSLGAGKEDILLLTPGRLAAEKGLEDLLDAVALARGRLSLRVRVAVVGEGPLREGLERRTAALGLGNQVVFTGFRSDINALLTAADIVALPSIREGLSIALLESMSAGRALIITSIGSNVEAAGETAERETAALIIPPGDSAALADAIVHLAESPALREQLGRRARAVWEERYTIERALLSYRSVYLELMQKRLFQVGTEFPA